MKEIMLGTLRAWSISRSSQQPSVLYWRLSDFTYVMLFRAVRRSALCTPLLFLHIYRCAWRYNLDFTLNLMVQLSQNTWYLCPYFFLYQYSIYPLLPLTVCVHRVSCDVINVILILSKFFHRFGIPNLFLFFLCHILWIPYIFFEHFVCDTKIII